MIDFEASHKKVVKLLEEELLPYDYKTAYRKTVVLSQQSDYSNGTDPQEKFRQYFADGWHTDICFIPGGYLALRRWFPDKTQLSLLPPSPPKIISGNQLLAYDAGFEGAMRWGYLFDYFHDAGAPWWAFLNQTKRYQKRRDSGIVESIVRNYFATHYPEFYIPNTNRGDNTKSSPDDFRLKVFNQDLTVDIKSWSYKDSNGNDIGVARNIRDTTIYLWADLIDDKNNVAMFGVSTGKFINLLGSKNEVSDLTHFPANHISHMDILLVMLNMARSGWSYYELRDKAIKYQPRRSKIA